MKTLLFISIIFLIACSTDRRVDINCEYQGGIVYNKSDLRYDEKGNGSVYFTIKHESKIRVVEAYGIDFDYKVEMLVYNSLGMGAQQQGQVASVPSVMNAAQGVQQSRVSGMPNQPVMDMGSLS